MIIINASFTLQREPTRILREKTQLVGSFNPSENILVTFSKIGMINKQLVGGFNPFEKYESNWIMSPKVGVNMKVATN